MRSFTLSELSQHPIAERVLVVVRDDRDRSTKFKERWEVPNVDWMTTSEQSALLETQLPTSIQPISMIDSIRRWLAAPNAPLAPFSQTRPVRDAIVTKESNSFQVRETVVELGFRKMFGIVSEPVGDARGPLVVMVNGANEDHVGPARLWVDLSRRWAGLGLRCVRFDLSERGESPWLPDNAPRPAWDKSQLLDVDDAVRAAIRAVRATPS